MQKPLTFRFIECLNFLKSSKKVPSTRQFSKTIGVHPQCISDIITGKRDVNSDIISKAIESYNMCATYLFTGKGEAFSSEVALPISQPKDQPQPAQPVIALITDKSGNERIVHVPYAAQAGYADQLNDPVFLQDLPTFTLPDPRFTSGSYRCFDITGDSMEPSIFANEKVVCEFVEPAHWISLKSNYVYVVIMNSGIVIKRVINNLKETQEFILKSDNNFYNNIYKHASEVKEIWQVTHKISAFMPSPTNIRNGLYQEMDNLRTTISDQGQIIQSLNTTIEKLLKQNRKETVSSRY